MESDFLGWSFVYGIYSGAVILLYGGLISVGVEYGQKKYLKKSVVFYIFAHAVFGLLFGLVFANWLFSLFSASVALIFAVIDLILRKIKWNVTFTVWVFVILILMYGAPYLYLEAISPPMPPFTKEDAVSFTTAGENTVIDTFPKEVGRWEGEINGYQVIKETRTEPLKGERYLVTFTESWKKGNESGTWYLSYEVSRNGLKLAEVGGDTRPNYR